MAARADALAWQGQTPSRGKTPLFSGRDMLRPIKARTYPRNPNKSLKNF
jgi:hypothetical protein